MRTRRASKYETLIELKRTRARKSRKCHACGGAINPGNDYFRESLGLISKPLGLQLNAFCLECKPRTQCE